MKNLPVMIGAALLAASAAWADAPDQFALHRAEFAKYHRMITGRDAPENAVRFSIALPTFLNCTPTTRYGNRISDLMRSRKSRIPISPRRFSRTPSTSIA